MEKVIFQILLLILLVVFCVGGFFITNHFLQLPFRSTNDSLHKKESPITLDFLIPGGTHIDEKLTIVEILNVRFEQETTFYEKILKSLSALIPGKYLYFADLILFVFFSFLYMTFMRVFTFMEYGRSMRLSLFLGAFTYYYMPDFTVGKGDDFFFIGVALLIIILKTYIQRRSARSIPADH